MRGTVVSVHGIRATVLLHDSGGRLRCRPLRSRQQLGIGDRVEVSSSRHGHQITSLEERERSLWRVTEHGSRLMASHVDRVYVVVAVTPPPSVGLIDRFLVAAELQGISVSIVLNKCDLDRAAVERGRELLACYVEVGYEVFEVSALSQLGLEPWREAMRDGFSVLAGHSGVGKSSLINAMFPGLDLAVRQTNEMTGKGRHTTSVSTCHAISGVWPNGGLLADTPGVRSFGLQGIEFTDLVGGFRELETLAQGCKFRDCLHEQEPGCAVREEALKDHAGRYASYLSILASLREGKG